MKPEPTSVPARTSHRVLSTLDRPHGGVGGGDQQQHEQRVGVVVAEHQNGHGREGQPGAGQQCRPGREPAPHGQVEQPDRGHAFQRLGHEDAPHVDAEEPGRQVHHPEGGWRLVDGDEVGRVERPEEERLPALAPGLHGGGVERVRPPGRAEAPEIEHRSADQQAEQGRSGPRRVGRAAPEEPSPPGRPGCARRHRPRGFPRGRRPAPRSPEPGPGGRTGGPGASGVGGQSVTELTRRLCPSPLGSPCAPSGTHL